MTDERRDGPRPALDDALRPKMSWAQLLPLLIVVLLGIELRLVFYQGVIHTDDLTYSHLAERLAEGVSPMAKPLPDLYAAARIGLYAPVALAYKLFGASDVTTLAWPFLLSLAGIVGAYGIGRLLSSEAAGLLAAFAVAVLPTHVAAATALLGDGPIATFSVGMVFLLVLAGTSDGWRARAAIAGSLGCFALGVVNKPLMLLVLPFFVFHSASGAKSGRVRAISLAAAGIGLAAYALYFGLGHATADRTWGAFWQRLAGTSTDLWRLLITGLPEFGWIAPLCVVAVVTTMAWRQRESSVVLMWLGLTFLYGELGTRTLTSYTPIVWYDQNTPARHVLLIITPAVMLAGMYLASGVSARAARWLVSISAAIVAAVAWVGSRGVDTITWGITNVAGGDLPFATLSGVASVVVLIGAVASPALLRLRSERARQATVFGLVLSVGLGSLAYSYRAANEFRGPWIDTFAEAVKFLETRPPQTIVVQNELFGRRLDYMSGFRFGFRGPLRPFLTSPRIELAPADPSGLRDAYVLIDEFYIRTARDLKPITGEPLAPDYFTNPPANWIQIAEFGKYKGNHLRVYRAPYRSAQAGLEAARVALANGRTPSALREFMYAAAGAGAHCDAVNAWHELRTTAPKEELLFNPVPSLGECYQTSGGEKLPSMLVNGDFSQGLSGWAKHPEAVATVRVDKAEDGTSIWHGSWHSGNWSLIYQEQIVQPNTVYVYEADVKATGPVISLYWQSDIGRYLEASSGYADWTHLRYVFVTPEWDGLPKAAGFIPVLVNKVAGDVWIKNVRLVEFHPWKTDGAPPPKRP